MFQINASSDCLKQKSPVYEKQIIPLNSVIKKVCLCFQDHAELLVGTKHLKYMEHPNGTRFFGMRKHDQMNVDFSFIKSTILQKLGFQVNTPILQVVGDSSNFSIEGTAFAHHFLVNKLAGLPNVLVCWGFTSVKTNDETTSDANGLVNKWITEDPSRAKKVIANVVDYGDKSPSDPENICDTSCVIEKYQATYPETNLNYYLVYDKAQFGDDITSSDKMTDMAICFEGGPQSWRQMVNFLSQNIKITGLFNLRGENNPSAFVKKWNTYAKFFSASEFIYLLKNKIKILKADGEVITNECIITFKNEYLSNHPMIHPDRHNGNSKLPLFEAAWKIFIEEKLWERLDNCEIVFCPNTSKNTQNKL